MIKKIGTVKTMIKKKGIIYTAKFAARKMNKMLPSVGHYKDNGVKTKKRYLLDKYLSDRSNKETKEAGIVKCHEKLTRKGDTVLVVGGGSGVTGVRAAWIVGDEGKVIIYEGGEESVKKIKNNIVKNGVDKTCEVRHSVIGSEINVYGGETRSASSVGPGELPACDVLELDCEGSEMEIIQKMKIRPRVIISEMHPWNTEYEAEDYINIFKKVGYDLSCAYGHEGIDVSREELKTLLSRSKEKEKKHIRSGARWPVVIAGVRSD